METLQIIIITLMIAGTAFILLRALSKYFTENLHKEVDHCLWESRIAEQTELLKKAVDAGAIKFPKTESKIEYPINAQHSFSIAPLNLDRPVNVNFPINLIHPVDLPGHIYSTVRGLDTCNHSWTQWLFIQELHNGNDAYTRVCMFCRERQHTVAKLMPKD